MFSIYQIIGIFQPPLREQHFYRHEQHRLTLRSIYFVDKISLGMNNQFKQTEFLISFDPEGRFVMYWGSVIWEYFINLIEVILFFIFIQTRLQPSRSMKRLHQKQFLFLLIRYISLCFLNQINISSWITITLTCLLEIIFSLLFFENSVITRIFWGFMFSVICMVAEYISIFIPQMFSNVDYTDVLIGGISRIPFTALYLALIAVFIFLIYFMSNKDVFLSFFQKLIYLIISVTGIMIGHFIMLVTLESEKLFSNTFFTLQLVYINLFFIGLFLALLIYIYLLGSSNAKNRKLLETQKTHELEELEYQSLLKSTSSLREMKHDIEIHLDTIQLLAANNNIPDLLSYIESYHHTLDHVHQFISTGNTAIDCILSSKITAAQKCGINIDFSVILPEPMSLS